MDIEIALGLVVIMLWSVLVVKDWSRLRIYKRRNYHQNRINEARHSLRNDLIWWFIVLATLIVNKIAGVYLEW